MQEIKGSALRRKLDQCLKAYREGTLSESDFEDLEELIERSPKQQLLYLQAMNSSVTSMILGMSMVREGNVWDGSSNPQDWPYQNVLAAINDGWRVIVFPDLALLMAPGLPAGLGCEFILEKWE